MQRSEQEKFLEQIETKFPIKYLELKSQYARPLEPDSKEYDLIKTVKKTSGLPFPVHKFEWPGMEKNYYIIKQQQPNKDVEIVETIYAWQKKMGGHEKGDLSIIKVPEGLENVLQDMTKISIFLENEEAVLAQLKKLNNLLVEEAQRQNYSVSDMKNTLKHKKLLRDVLERELGQLGFNPKFGYALDLLPTPDFLALLKNGIIIKDPGAGKAHGEFTHAIQWLMIGWQQKDTSFLSEPAIKIFKRLGKDPQGNRAWDFTVDLILENNCRAPEYLTNVIMKSDDPDLSLLQSLYISRYKKREMEDAKKEKPNLFTPGKKERYIESNVPGLLLPKVKK